MKQIREYQQTIISEVERAVSEGCRRPLVVMPCGCGKTFTAATMAKTHMTTPGAKGVLWFAHRDELVSQPYRALTDLGLQVGCSSANSAGMVINPHRPVQVATIQSLIARKIRPPASLIIADECHHLSFGSEWAKIIDDYPDAIICGLSATPERADGTPLHGFNRLIVGISAADAIAQGYLVPCEVVRPKFYLGSKKIAQNPVAAWLKDARGTKTILFAANRKAAEEYLAQFRAAGIGAEFVHYKSPNRARLLQDHAAGKFPVLINISILVEGYDDPSVQTIILARTIGSLSLFLQIVGRGIRACPGKQSMLLLDLAGETHNHGMPDEDREYSLTGKGIRRKGEVLPFRFCPICSAVIAQNDTICGECAQPLPEMKPPEVTGDPLVKFARVRKRNETERKAHYFRMLDEAKKAGHKTGKAYWRFKSTYDADPPFAWLREWSANRS